MSRLVSLSWSRRLMVSRLSYFFLPLPRAMMILINLPPVNNFVGTMVIPCFFASVKCANCRLLTNNFRAEVSTLRVFACPRSFNRSEKLALFSHNSPFLKLTKA